MCGHPSRCVLMDCSRARPGTMKRWSRRLVLVGSVFTASLSAPPEPVTEEVVVEVDGPEGFAIDDADPMGLSDVASVFPFAGPFAPGPDGAPGDRFLHESLTDVDRGFLTQLVPVLQSRWEGSVHPCSREVARLCPHSDSPLHCLGLATADGSKQLSPQCTQEIKHAVPFVCSHQIQQYCDGDLEQGILPCLEGKGSFLGNECLDSIIAAKHAISSLQASRRKALGNIQGTTKSPAKAAAAQFPAGVTKCPSGWSGPQAGGCCVRRWSPQCADICAADRCNTAAGNWEFKWADFRTHPYICCPQAKKAASKYVDGQPRCPSGWYSEPKQESQKLCCRRPWAWDCGRNCALDNCQRIPGFAWVAVDEKQEHYRCCPGSSISRLKSSEISVPADDIPAALGASWVSEPIDLSEYTWPIGTFIAVAVALLLVARRWLSGRSVKEH